MGFVYAIWRKFANPNEFVWIEFPIQILVGVLSTVLVFACLYYEATDLKDYEILNSYAQRAEYHEPWTEWVTVCTKVGKSTSCTRHCTGFHGPEWIIYHKNTRETAIAQSNYKNLVSRFGNEKHFHIFRPNQCSIGNGNGDVTTYGGEPQKLVPTAKEHQYVNYIKGSKTTIRRRSLVNISGYQKQLKEYPHVHNGTYGEIEFDRVVDVGNVMSKEWQTQVDYQLDTTLSTLGEKKEVNILLYLIPDNRTAFSAALEAFWVGGKKNDVVVLIGTDGKKIDWTEILSWTTQEDFKTKLKRRISDLGSLDQNGSQLATIITDQVSQPKESGGFVRRPMQDFEYLAEEVELPVWAGLLMILIVGLLVWATSWALEHNEIDSSF